MTADHSTNIPLQVGMDDDISRIPLLFFLPEELRKQLGTVDTHVLGATYDFAPSIADLLGRAQAKDWLGMSLFHPRVRGGVESVSELDKVGVRRANGTSATAKFTDYGDRFTFFDQTSNAKDDEALAGCFELRDRARFYDSRTQLVCAEPAIHESPHKHFKLQDVSIGRWHHDKRE